MASDPCWQARKLGADKRRQNKKLEEDLAFKESPMDFGNEYKGQFEGQMDKFKDELKKQIEDNKKRKEQEKTSQDQLVKEEEAAYNRTIQDLKKQQEEMDRIVMEKIQNENNKQQLEIMENDMSKVNDNQPDNSPNNSDEDFDIDFLMEKARKKINTKRKVNKAKYVESTGSDLLNLEGDF